MKRKMKYLFFLIKIDTLDAVDALCAIGGMPNVNPHVRAKMKNELKRKLGLIN